MTYEEVVHDGEPAVERLGLGLVLHKARRRGGPRLALVCARACAARSRAAGGAGASGGASDRWPCGGGHGGRNTPRATRVGTQLLAS